MRMPPRAALGPVGADGPPVAPHVERAHCREVGQAGQIRRCRIPVCVGISEGRASEILTQTRIEGVAGRIGRGCEAGRCWIDGRRLGVREVGGEAGAAREQGDRPSVGVHLHRLDGAHPGGPCAPAGQPVGPDVGQVRVPPVGEGLELVGDRRRGGGEIGRRDRGDVDGAPRRSRCRRWRRRCRGRARGAVPYTLST